MAPLQSMIDRRTVLKLIGAVGAWPAFAPTMGAAQSDISRFRINISDEELADLHRRLWNIRWPPGARGEAGFVVGLTGTAHAPALVVGLKNGAVAVPMSV